MPKIAMKSISYLPDWKFRFKQGDQYLQVTKDFVADGDDFLMTMTLFQFDEEIVCWIGMDMGRCDKGFYEVMWACMHKNFPELKKDNFFVNGTHTHAGPVFTKYQEMGPESETLEGMDRLAWHCGSLAVSLYRELKPVLEPFTSEIRTVQIEGCYSNRNRLDGPCDKTVTLIRFRHAETKKPLGIWFSMNCHSTITFPANKRLSSDLVGTVYKNVSRHYGVPVMPFCGAQGDTSTRLTRHRTDDPENDFAELKRISDSVTKQVLVAPEAFQSLVIDRFETRKYAVSFMYDLEPRTLEKAIAEAEKELTQAEGRENIRTHQIKLKALQNKYHGPTHFDASIPCTAINMGELKLAAISGELVASLGLAIVRHHEHDHRMVVCYINDRACGYLVEREEYGKNFESASSIIPVGIPEVIRDMSIRELDQFELENKQE